MKKDFKDFLNKFRNIKLAYLHNLYFMFTGDRGPYDAYMKYIEKYGLVELVDVGDKNAKKV